VRDVSLLVPGGRFVTLLGPSGSGKTTLLMMIAGFLSPTRGDIFLDGRNITGIPAYRRNFGVVFQSYALFPHMTVRKNVEFPLRMRGVPSAQRHAKARETLELVRLAEYEARLPAQLSGGQQQRVALARAVVFDPPVLLMDEPLGALDRQLREHMQGELRQLHRQLGITVLYVTHDQEEALTMSDVVVLLNEGRVEQVGAPDALYERPRNAFVAQFLGETNLLTARVVQRVAEGYRVSVGRFMLEVASAGDLEVGQVVQVSIRPEKICVLPDQAAFPGNVMGAVVEDVGYVGAQSRYRFQAEGVSLVMRGPSGQVGRGEKCWIGVKRTDPQVLGDRETRDESAVREGTEEPQ
jgi:putative spermidine/putrescine transport system ATP-binding protein